MAGDGNCFYRAVSLTIGKKEEDYKVLKDSLSNFVIQKAQFYSYLGDVEQLALLLRREGEAATYECLRITADYLHSTIVLHRNLFPAEHPEVFAYPSPERSMPLNLLFRGPWRYGHFLAVLPKDIPAHESNLVIRETLRNSTADQSAPPHLLDSKLLTQPTSTRLAKQQTPTPTMLSSGKCIQLSDDSSIATNFQHHAATKTTSPSFAYMSGKMHPTEKKDIK